MADIELVIAPDTSRNAIRLRGLLIAALTDITDGQVLAWDAANERFVPVDVEDVIDDQVTWAQVDKTGSSLADLTTRSASALNAGTLPDAVFPAALPAINGAAVTNLTTANLTGTTLPGSIVTSSLTAVGTIATGTWQGTPVGVAYGGTGFTSYTAGDIQYATGATTLAKLPVGAAGTVLVGNGAAPSYSATPTVTSVQVGTGVGVLFGGATSGHVGLKGNGAELQVRTGDDGGYAALLASSLRINIVGSTHGGFTTDGGGNLFVSVGASNYVNFASSTIALGTAAATLAIGGNQVTFGTTGGVAEVRMFRSASGTLSIDNAAGSMITRLITKANLFELVGPSGGAVLRADGDGTMSLTNSSVTTYGQLGLNSILLTDASAPAYRFSGAAATGVTFSVNGGSSIVRWNASGEDLGPNALLFGAALGTNDVTVQRGGTRQLDVVGSGLTTFQVRNGSSVIGTIIAGSSNIAIGSVSAVNLLIQVANATVWRFDQAAGGDLVSAGSQSIDAGGALRSRSATAGVGYSTGAGGTVTQGTSKSTGVTLNKVSGAITMHNAELAAGVKVSFVVTNSAVASTDGVQPWVASGGTANAYRADVTAVGSGSFTITVENITGGPLSEAPVIGFALIKAVTT